MSALRELRPLELRTRDPFTIARGGSERWHNLLLRIEIDGHEGLGEGAPRDYYGESVEEGLAALRAVLADRETLGAEAAEAILEAFTGPASAKAALDIAMHDALARARGVAVHEDLEARYDLKRGALPRSSFTIGLADTARMQEKVREAAGYPILKVKLGTDRDLEIVRAIREVTDAELRIDANAAWSVDETREKAPRLAELGVTLIEQPLPREDLAGFRELHGTLPLPVFADESCRDLADVERLVGAVDGINIKLGKSGGLREAARMIRRAREAELTVMVGCFIESSIAITAAGSLAPFVDVLDLDGAALLEQDPFAGLEIPEGRVLLPAGPGLGVAPRTS